MNVTVEMALGIVKRPSLAAYCRRLARAAYVPVAPLSAKVSVTAEPVTFEESAALPYKSIKIGEPWGGFFECAWFEFEGAIGEEKGDLAAIIDIGGEGCVFDEDGAVQGTTNVLSPGDFFQIVPGKKIIDLDKLGTDAAGNIRFKLGAGNNGRFGKSLGKARLVRAEVCRRRKDISDLFYDIVALAQFSDVTEDKELKAKIEGALRSAVIRDFSAENVAAARARLAECYSKKEDTLEVFAVGHAHLDLAWLWPIRETKRKAVRTYTNALANIEKYPSFIFGSSQPQQFEWMKEEYPTLFERIKKAVADGRIEPQGGMWVEPDTNVPCGESLIRQCYYGKRFFKENFGAEIDTLWVPDVFGYSGNLPQIIKKCGMNNFMTIKLSWNTVNKFPYHSFNWEGIDGSRVLVHMPPEGDYNSTGSPYALKKIATEYRERDIANVALMPLGTGDGGGGPGEYFLEMTERTPRMQGLPRVRYGTSKEFFARLSEFKEALPSYKGELYLEKHQGTYTSQANNKKNNRRTERALHDAEWLCTLAYAKGKPYPHEAFDRLWKETLLYQFHDILPGSSIERVYKESTERYAQMQAECQALAEDAMHYLGGKGKYLLNPSPFERSGYVTEENKLFKYRAPAYGSAQLKETTVDGVKITENGIENEFLRVEFNPNGEISSMYNKSAKRETLAATSNVLMIYTDKKMIPYDAWDIDIKYPKRYKERLGLVKSETTVEGASVVRTNYFAYNKSHLTQRLVLTAGCPYLKAETSVDWQEKHKMLRADFYPADYADKVRCDIQFGSIERSTLTEDSRDYAQFEIPAHKWVNVDKDGSGFAVINDCKYGHRVKNGLISLNLLRAPTYPDKNADIGKHEFCYAAYPHEGTALESELLRCGYEINAPILASHTEIAPIATVTEGVILESVFVNDAGQIVLRLYEAKGKTCTAAVNLGLKDYAILGEADMLCENITPCEAAKLEFTPFEVKTLIVSKQKTVK